MLNLDTLTELGADTLDLEQLLIVSRINLDWKGPNNLTDTVERFKKGVSDKYVTLIGRWLEEGLATQLFFKQFRAADGSGNACYQEILSAEYSSSKPPSSIPMNGEYNVRVFPSHIAPLHDQVGMPRSVNATGNRRVQFSDQLVISTATTHWRMAVDPVPRMPHK